MRLSEVKPGMRLMAYVSDSGLGIEKKDVFILDRIEKSFLNDDTHFYMYLDSGSAFCSRLVDLEKEDFLSIFNIVDDSPRIVRRSGRYPWETKNLTRDLPKVKFIQVNGEYTTAVWQDGTHTVVKLADWDMYDEDKLYMILVMKKIFGNNNSAMRRYFKQFSDNVKEV